MMVRPLAAPLILLMLLFGGLAHAQPVRTDHAEAALHAERLHAVPGETLWMALRLLPDPGWHTYWRNPGDSGLPTRIDWTLPDGVLAGDIHWPAPSVFRLADIVNYGYGEETLHLVPITLPADWPAGEPLQLAAFAEWLICADICVPEAAELTLTLPTAATPAAHDPDWADSFAAARARLPAPVDWPARFDVDAATLRLAVELPAGQFDESARFRLYPHANDLVDHSAPASLQRDAARLWLAQPRSRYAAATPAASDWTLVAEQGDAIHAVQLRADRGAPPPVSAEARAVTTGPGDISAPGGGVPLPLALLFALLGGLLLNLMPCVFPVLAIKALGVVEARGHARREQRLHALAYTGGVLASCLLAAAALLALRAGGQALGWGFQLQSPLFIAALIYLFFALGLSLSGLTAFGTRLMGLGQNLVGDGRSRGGAFMTGVLAVIVASPCTAPFMGTALGYAVVQPAGVALAVFAALGLGLALPFLLIGFVPMLARALPRPGAWMETFKQAMAFPLYLSVAWLLWVLVRQTGALVQVAVLVGMVLLAMALWLQQRPRRWARLLAWLALLAAVALPVTAVREPPQLAAEPWSQARVEALRAEGRNVFVNFTADWCVTCLANERVALASKPVQRAFAAHDVVYLKADWTRSDPAITAALAEFGRNGVPLYLLYLDGGEPQVLPQLLTPATVTDRFPSP